MNAPELREYAPGYHVARDGRVYQPSDGEMAELRPARVRGDSVQYTIRLDGRRVSVTRHRLLAEVWPEDGDPRADAKAQAKAAAAARMRAVRAVKRAAGAEDDDGLEGLAQRWTDVASWAFGVDRVAHLLGVDPGQVHSWRRGVVPGHEWHGALERLYTLARAETYGISDAAARLRAGDAAVRRLVVWGEM